MDWNRVRVCVAERQAERARLCKPRVQYVQRQYNGVRGVVVTIH